MLLQCRKVIVFVLYGLVLGLLGLHGKSQGVSQKSPCGDKVSTGLGMPKLQHWDVSETIAYQQTPVRTQLFLTQTTQIYIKKKK